MEKTNLEKKELIKSITNLKGNFKDYLEMFFNNLITKFDKEDDNKKNVRKIKGRNYEEGEKIGRYNTARTLQKWANLMNNNKWKWILKNLRLF